jgi:hypothetical protein
VVLSGAVGGGDEVEGDVELAGQRGEDLVVGDHGHDLGVQLLEGVPHQDVRETVVLLRRQHDDAPGLLLRQSDAGPHGERRAHVLQQRRSVDRAVELGAHVEPPRGSVHELLVADDVEALPEQRTGDAMNQTGAIGTFNEENRGLQGAILSRCIAGLQARDDGDGFASGQGALHRTTAIVRPNSSESKGFSIGQLQSRQSETVSFKSAATAGGEDLARPRRTESAVRLDALLRATVHHGR